MWPGQFKIKLTRWSLELFGAIWPVKGDDVDLMVSGALRVVSVGFILAAWLSPVGGQPGYCVVSCLAGYPLGSADQITCSDS